LARALKEPSPQSEPEVTASGQGGLPEEGRSSGAPRPIKKRVLFAAKLLFSLALIAWIIGAVDWSDIGERIAQMSWVFIAVAILILVQGVVCSAMKWQQLLAVHGAPYRLWTLIRWYFIATFFGQFLPSMIGGDAYRIYRTLDNPAGKMSAVLAIFVERATGLLALVSMGWLAAVIYYEQTGDVVARWLMIVGSCGAVFAMASFVVIIKFKLLGKIARAPKCPKNVRALIERAWEYRRSPWRVTAVCLLSLWFHATRVGIYAMLFWALGEPQGVIPVLIAITLTTVVSMIPISLNGYGLVDGSFILLMVGFGASEEAATAVMVLFRGTTIPVSAVGGVFYFADNGSKPPRKSEAAGAIRAEE